MYGHENTTHTVCYRLFTELSLYYRIVKTDQTLNPMMVIVIVKVIVIAIAILIVDSDSETES